MKLATMNFNSESAKNQQSKQQHASFSNSPSQDLYLRYPYNYGVVVPGVFMPLSSYTMFPNAANVLPVPSVFRDSFPNGIREDWTGHGSLGLASGQIQTQKLSTNSAPGFDSPLQNETLGASAAMAQQNFVFETTAYDTSSDELDLPESGTLSYAYSNSDSQYRTTEHQDWHNHFGARGNMQTGIDFGWQDTANNPFMSGTEQHASTNSLNSNGSREKTHSSGYGTYNLPHNPVSSNTEPNSSFNASLESLNPTYGTSPSSQGTSTLAPSSSPEASFSSTSNTSPIPSPINAPSTTSMRHHCPNCTSTFARQGDLRRHERIHFPGRRYHCREPGCARNGRKGFTRRDKLRDHARGVHGLEEDEIGF